jgi:hypothetical protein
VRGDSVALAKELRGIGWALKSTTGLKFRLRNYATHQKRCLLLEVVFLYFVFKKKLHMCPLYDRINDFHLLTSVIKLGTD